MDLTPCGCGEVHCFADRARSDVHAPGELLADADFIHYTMDASEKDEEEAQATNPNVPMQPKRQPPLWQIYGLIQFRSQDS
jgi:hypothetical protein